MNFLKKLSYVGLVLIVFGVGALWISLGDTIISFKQAKDFEDVLDGDVAAGDHVSGEVIFLLDPFASMQTWTKNSKTGSVTPKKTSSQYYVLPGGEGYVGLTVHSKDFSVADKLVDQTYDYLNDYTMPTEELTVDACVVVMEEELAEMFREEMKEYYGYTDQDLDDMGPILMIEPRNFTAVRIVSGVGAALIAAGVIVIILHWRKMSAEIRKEKEEAPGPDLD
ncbi:MAG: hypothetical protein K2O11_02900 [Oscillospiraceae bacterium]|nr:hypothetical protein [Oscillospiraceae bacterium]